MNAVLPIATLGGPQDPPPPCPTCGGMGVLAFYESLMPLPVSFVLQGMDLQPIRHSRAYQLELCHCPDCPTIGA